MVRLVAMLIAAVAVAAPAGAQTAPDIRPFIASEVAAGVHLLAVRPDYQGTAPGNVSVIEQRDGVVLIDAGQNAADGRRIVAFVKSITSKPVIAIVFSHWHSDHLLGASEIRAAWPKVRIIATGRTAETLRRSSVRLIGLAPQDSYIRRQQGELQQVIASIDGPMARAPLSPADRQDLQRIRADAVARIADFPGTHLVLPTETFGDRLMLSDPIRPVQLRYLGRGNTDGDIVAWLPKQGVLMTGDIVVAPIPFGTGSYPSAWIETLRQVRGLPFTRLIPGHGPVMSDRTHIDRMIASITAIRDAIAQAAKSGLDFKAVKAKVNLAAEIGRFGPHPPVAVARLWIAPLADNAYREAKNLPIVQSADPQPDPQ